jgi:hypothetical protein
VLYETGIAAGSPRVSDVTGVSTGSTTRGSCRYWRNLLTLLRVIPFPAAISVARRLVCQKHLLYHTLAVRRHVLRQEVCPLQYQMTRFALLSSNR